VNPNSREVSVRTKRVSTIWYVNTADPAAVLRTAGAGDTAAAHAVAGRLHSDRDAVAVGSDTLVAAAGPGPGSVYVGCWDEVAVVCSAQFSVPRPSQLPRDLIGGSENTYLVSMNPDLGWGGFAHWQRGSLRRSFSATRVNILEDEGLPMVWERPFWAGEHPMPIDLDRRLDPHRLPFDPLHFADAANAEWLGFRLNGPDRPALTVCGFALYPLGEAPEPARSESRLGRWSRRLTALAK
jgi:hypothetical protein